MSYTLKKLKQSEIDRGYRKPISKKKPSALHGLFIACFAVMLALILGVIYRMQDQNVVVSPDTSESLTTKQARKVKSIEAPIVKQQSEKQAEVKPNENDIVAANGNGHSSLKKANENPIHGREKNVSIEQQADLKKDKTGLLPKRLLLFQELPINFQRSLPEIEINGIAFFKKKKDRFVFINMTKYRVDDIVEPELSLEEIRRNSIVMRYQNRRFILSVDK